MTVRPCVLLRMIPGAAAMAPIILAGFELASNVVLGALLFWSGPILAADAIVGRARVAGGDYVGFFRYQLPMLR